MSEQENEFEPTEHQAEAAGVGAGAVEHPGPAACSIESGCACGQELDVAQKDQAKPC